MGISYVMTNILLFIIIATRKAIYLVKHSFYPASQQLRHYQVKANHMTQEK